MNRFESMRHKLKKSFFNSAVFTSAVFYSGFIACFAAPETHALEFDFNQFTVATGALQTYESAAQYCYNTRARLPTIDEAVFFFKTFVDPKTGVSLLKNFDDRPTTGDFWTSATKKAFLFRCPVALIPTESGVDFNFGKVCSHKAKKLIVCVKDSDSTNKEEPARNTDQLLIAP